MSGAQSGRSGAEPGDLEKRSPAIRITYCTQCQWLLRAGWMAQEHDIRLIPHGWNTAVGLAADLQLASALAHTDLVEYISGSPFVDELTTGGWRLDEDGTLPIPDGPGLGIELNPDALSQFTTQSRNS